MFDLIINPMAKRGRGLDEVRRVESYFAKKNIDYIEHYTKYVKHATELSYDLTLQSADVIVACGGDGTIHEVINGIIKAKQKMANEGLQCNTKLGILPCGTGNDFMRSAGMSIATLEAADVLISGKPQNVDAINIDGRYEITFACKGIDVDVVNMVNASAKKTESSYLKNILKCIFKRINYDFDILADGEHIKYNGVFTAVLNGGKVAGGIDFCPDAKVDDGFLNLVMIKHQNLFKMLYTLLMIFKGRANSTSGVEFRKCKTVTVTNQQTVTDIDGELFENINFEATIAPNALLLIK
ncbi:MAG: diacylglycerol kinase family lipid kinase [Clostridia bacterium]